MQYNFSALKVELKKVEEFLAKEYNQLNVGRAMPSVLDSISVESYGAKMPIKNVASIAIEDPKTLRISPWDKNQIKDIERAVAAANLGLSVAVDEAGIRVIFPQFTTETRQKLVKVLKEKLENSRITARHERERALKDMEAQVKIGKMNEDEKFRGKTELDKLIAETNKNLEAIFNRKEKEVMG